MVLLFIGVSNGNQGVMVLFVMWFAYMYWREQMTPYITKKGYLTLIKYFQPVLHYWSSPPC